MSRSSAAVVALSLLLAAGCAADPAADSSAGSSARAADRTTAADGSAAADPGRSAAATPSAGTRPTHRPGSPAASRRVVPSGGPARENPSVELRPFRTVTGPLLSARDLGRTWSVAGTGPERGRLVSACQRAPLVDIGALTSRIREFAGSGTSARQAVSGFADGRSARRAEHVVAAWREDCARALHRRAAALGAVRHHQRLSVVEITGVPHPDRRMRRLLDRVRAGFDRA